MVQRLGVGILDPMGTKMRPGFAEALALRYNRPADRRVRLCQVQGCGDPLDTKSVSPLARPVKPGAVFVMINPE